MIIQRGLTNASGREHGEKVEEIECECGGSINYP
jgi:hypothetical protein